MGNPVASLIETLRDAGLGDGWIFAISGLLGAIGILSFVGLAAVINIWVERRLIGRIQVRRGPNRVGPFGLLQPIADAIKLIQKEALQPDNADGIMFTLAPIVIFIPAILAFAVLPWGEHMILADLNVGVLFILALGSTNTIIIFMAGYASNNKYALLGSMRVIAMLISYELPVVLALLGVVLFASTMSLSGIVAFQETHWVWLIFLQPLAFLIFLLGSTAELNRTPADIAEAESEIVAGFHIEYSGMKFGLFYAVELVNVVAVSAVITTLFLGGWWTFGLEKFVPGWMIFIGKLYAVYFIFIWFRGTLPRFRVDQLMAFAWKVLLPLSIVNVLMVALQVFIWTEYELSAGVVLPIFGVVNFALAGALIAGFAKLMTRNMERFPKRPRLVPDIDVPLPEPSTV
ncbi:MAG: NADH-quinone oxidoreductase subunit NuoH [Chloroflexi bacterium]|nr:NADH-quinone oxidoreductase subunit NuoH [Chloroflexota bacterium]MCI0856793.1 NADH-quinone oxidoreductase subunit NuoH [Chloroflexota bacterium]MCI0890416.1 NADH-quinone oxidoreductase subunit NuoH [Chloroflexota bacterium]